MAYRGLQARDPVPRVRATPSLRGYLWSTSKRRTFYAQPRKAYLMTGAYDGPLAFKASVASRDSQPALRCYVHGGMAPAADVRS
jgi:hypothetical protein